MKLFVSRFFHETATFAKTKTTLSLFKNNNYSNGQEFYQSRVNTKSVVGGIIDVATENGVELFFSHNAGAQPSGIVTEEAYLDYIEKITNDLKKETGFDGIILDLHGAMVVEGIDDAESAVLTHVKNLTNHKIPIMIVLDYHANIGQTTIDNCEAVIVYKTYPHVDMYECGLDVTNLMIRHLKKEITPTIAYRNLPFMSALLAQGTFREPMKSILQTVQEYETNNEKVLNISLAAGFPYADIKENGFSIIVHTNNDQALAQKILDDLSELVWSKRGEFIPKTVSIEEAVSLASGAPYNKKTIILCDAADNPGGGSAGDGVAILKELIRQKVEGALVSTIWDTESTALLYQHKEGDTVEIILGGRSPEHENTGIKLSVKILSFRDGRYILKGPFNHGSKANIGRTALVEVDGIKVIVHEKKAQTIDREIIRFTGVNPEDQKILVVKSTLHYRADFEQIAERIIEVDSPGIVRPDLFELDYKNIRKPIFPLDQNMAKPF